MRDAYSQAMRFYLVRPTRSLMLGMFTAMGLLMTATAMVVRIRSDAANFLLGHLFLSMVLWLMFHEQVIGPRRRLLPNFVGPQVAAFAVYLLILLALLTTVTSLSAGLTVVRAAAVVGFFLAGVGLVILTKSVVLMGVFFVVSYGPVVGLPVVAWAWITPGLAPLVLAASALAVALIVIGFLRTTDENAWAGGLNGNTLFPRATGDGNQPWAAASDSRWRRLLTLRRTWSTPAGTAWQRVRRWHCQSRVSFLLLAAWFCGISLYFRWPLADASSVRPPRSQPDMSSLFLGILVSQIWLQRWPYLGTELLRPVSRPDYFKQLGGAMAIDFAIAFAICVAAMAVPQLVFSPAPDALRLVMLQAVAGGGLFVLVFGVTALVLRYRSRGMLMIAVAVLLPMGLLPIFLTEPLWDALSMAGFLTAVAAVALTGVALSVHAYRSWLKVELA